MMKNYLLVSQTFSLFGLEISYYGFIIAMAMLLGVLCAIFIVKKKKIKSDMPINLALYALPLAIIGARIYYCIFNGVNDFWQIFRIWEGGMAIYGGVIGGFLGVLLCCKIHKYSLLQACDIASPCLILGQAVGRIGCYFAGCCYGIETTNPALMVFPISVQINSVWHLATFFYESFFDFLGFILLMVVTLKTDKKGVVLSGYLITYGTIRAILEYFRDPAESLTIGAIGIRVSLMLSIILVIFGVILLFVLLNKKDKSNEQLQNS